MHAEDLRAPLAHLAWTAPVHQHTLLLFVQRCQLAALEGSDARAPAAARLRRLRTLHDVFTELDAGIHDALKPVVRLMTTAILLRAIGQHALPLPDFLDLAARVRSLSTGDTGGGAAGADGARPAANTDQRIQQAMAFLQESYARFDLHEKTAAAVVGLSRSRFSQLFTASVGVGFRSYLRFLRLREVIRALEATEETVKAVALSTGYRHTSVLDRECRQVFGLRPLEVRALARQPIEAMIRPGSIVDGRARGAPHRRANAPLTFRTRC